MWGWLVLMWKNLATRAEVAAPEMVLWTDVALTLPAMTDEALTMTAFTDETLTLSAMTGEEIVN